MQKIQINQYILHIADTRHKLLRISHRHTHIFIVLSRQMHTAEGPLVQCPQLLNRAVFVYSQAALLEILNFCEGGSGSGSWLQL